MWSHLKEKTGIKKMIFNNFYRFKRLNKNNKI